MSSQIMDQIIHSLSNCPHLHCVWVSVDGINNDIPCAPFHGLTHLKINDHGSLDYVPAIVANSPNLFSLEVAISRYDSPSPSQFPVLSLFGVFAEGTHSSVQEVDLAGDYLSLEPSTVPALIQHFRNLSIFLVPVGFDAPDEFWDALLDANVHLRNVRSCSNSGLAASFLEYLGGYQGLEEFHFRPPIDTQDAQEIFHSEFFRSHIIPVHSSSLTIVAVVPGSAGSWCFGGPMLKALLLCPNLVYISISVDGQSVQEKLSENVIVSLCFNRVSIVDVISSILTDKNTRERSTLAISGTSGNRIRDIC